MARGKILVIRGGAIGDFILTLPVLAALKQTFPETELHVLGYPQVAKLASLGGLADGVRSIEAQSLAGFFARNGTLSEELAAYFASFAIIISFLYDPDEIFQNNVARCSKAQFIAGPHRPNENQNVHATEVFLKPLERLAIFDADPTPRLAAQLQPVTLKRVAIHPGSGSEKKNWPEDKWKELLQLLEKQTTGNFLLVGGEAEGRKLQRLAATIAGDRVQLAQSLPLTELATQLAASRFFLGHDSGISHLAAAVGLPGLVLWGETKEQIWRPRSDTIKVLPAEQGLGKLDVQKVFAAAAPALRLTDT